MMNKLASLRRLAPGSLSLLAKSVVLVAALFSLCQTAKIEAQTGGGRVVLQPRGLAAGGTAVDTGQMPSSERLSLTLTLAPTPARGAALDAYLAALTTPLSPSYHQWLTPAQFAASYGAKADQLTAATTWAQAQGLSVDSVSAAGTRLAVSGSVSAVQAAFAVSLHHYQVAASVYFASTTDPSLPSAVAPLFAAVDGLDNLPSSSPLQLVTPAAANTPAGLTTLAGLVDANATPMLALTSTTGAASLSTAQLAEYELLFRQAAAQGITTIASTSTGSFPGLLPEVTALALPGDAALTDTPVAARPAWQVAAGLAADNLRYAPDLTASSLNAFVQAMAGIAGGSRLGNINQTLYTLAPEPGVFTQADGAASGTWEAASGLGLVDLNKLATAFPRGTGMSFTSFSATNYSPTYGQGTSFTSNVTSGTGGNTPTGTVSFVTSAGVNLGTVALVNGSATLAINTLNGGNYIINAVYSGDGTYATSQSPTAQIYVAPAPSQLTASITGNPTVGSSFTVTVTDSATLGAPTGPITVAISGTGNVYTGTLTPLTATSSTATFSIPSPAPGTITLSITCTTSANYSCYNPLTTTVTIAKATPVLSISYSPNPPVSGQSIALNAVVSTIGTAPAPTGAVTFLDNGTTLNSAQLSNGSANTTGTVPTTATHSITATYAGDPNYNPVSTNGSSTSSGTIATSTALSGSSSVVTAGQNITFTAVISPSSTGPASPTGTVQFFDGGTSLGTANLTGNAAQFTTNALSASANHSITATYSGDTYYASSTSGPLPLTSSTSSMTTTTALIASSTTPVHGRSLTFTATVAPPAGGNTPTGTVTFTSSPLGQLGSAPLVNGVAMLTTTQLPGGTDTVTATYNGSTTYNSSLSAVVTLTVTPEPTQISPAAASGAIFGSSFVVSVTISGSSGIGSPTGTVTVQPTGNGYSASSSAALASSGTTSLGTSNVAVPALGAGTVILSVSYSGDANFAPSGPVSVAQTVARASSSTLLTFTPNPIVAGQPASLIAKVSFVGSIAPTGTVQFLDGTTVLGTGSLNAQGTATLSSTLAAGNHTLSASYAGDGNYLPSSSPSTNTSTGTNLTSIALSINPSTAVVGSTITLSATVGPNGNGATPTGTVQFVTGGSVLCTAALANSVASCTITANTLGVTSITASYLGDANYAANTSSAGTLNTVTGAGTLVATVSPASGAGGTAATITATVMAPAGTVPTGTIQAIVTNAAGASVASYTAQLPGTGTATTATVNLPIALPTTAGTYTVTVACVNTNFTCTSQSLSVTSTSTTTPAGTATLVAIVTPSTALPGSNVTVQGTISAPGVNITGVLTATVTNSAGVAVGTATYTFPGTATGSAGFQFPLTTPAAAGSYTVTIACTSTAFTCTPVTATLVSSTTAASLIPTTTTLVASASTTATGATTLTATVTPMVAGTASPTGTVIFYDGTTPIGIATLSSTGTATVSVTLSSATKHSLTAVYSGDASYAGSVSAAVTGTTAVTAATISLTSSATSGLAGGTVVLTAQVRGLTATNTSPTGTVSFYANGVTPALLGTVSLTASSTGLSIAVLSTSGLPSGTQTIYAVYNGDTNFSPVTSNSITIGLTDYSVIFSPPSITVVRGTTGISTATVTVSGPFTGTIALGCTPAPNTLITCSFSPAVLTAGGTSTLSVTTVAARAALEPAGLPGGGFGMKALTGGISLAALVCLLVPGRNRRRIPALLVLLLSFGLATSLGCSDSTTFGNSSNTSGTPLGSSILTINTAGSDGTNTIRHNYSFQVNVQ